MSTNDFAQPLLGQAQQQAVNVASAVSGSVTVQHNDVKVAGEPIIDFKDAGANVFTVADDSVNTRITITPPKMLTGRITGSSIVGGTGFSLLKNGTGDYSISYNVAFPAVPVVSVTPVSSSLEVVAMEVTPVASAFRVFFYNTAGALTDPDGFQFFVMAVA